MVILIPNGNLVFGGSFFKSLHKGAVRPGFSPRPVSFYLGIHSHND